MVCMLLCCVMVCMCFSRSHIITTVSIFESVRFNYRHSKCAKLTYHRFCCFHFAIPHYFDNAISEFLNNDSNIYYFKKFVS